LTDGMASALFGDIIGQYQQIGEGMYETAVRVVAEKEQILQAISMTGHAFSGTATEAVHFSQALIKLAGDLETLTEDVGTYFEEYLTEAEQLEWLTGNLAKGYAAINQTMPETRQGFKDLIESLDLTNDADAKLYTQLLALAGATDAYYDALERANQTVIDAQRKLTGTEESGSISDIEKRYGWDISEDNAFDFIRKFISMSPDEIAAYAKAVGVSVEDLTDDIMTLADVFGWFSDEAGQAAVNMSELAQSIRDNLASIRADIYGTGSGASSLYSAIVSKKDEVASALSAGDMDTAMGILQIMSQDLGTWYQQARAERIAEETDRLNGEREILNEQLAVANAFGSLVTSIEGVINGIKYSTLNTTLPTPKAEMAKGDYRTLRDAAMSSGSVEDYQAFTGFANTALTQYQAAYKSSETYQKFYDEVMADLEAAKANAEAESYDEAILSSLEAIEDSLQNIDMSGIVSDFESVATYIEGMLGQLEKTEFLLNIDWANYEGSMADALASLQWIGETYGWDNPITLEFISEMAEWAAQDINNAIAIMDEISDKSGGWDSTASITFIAALGENMTNLNDAAAVLDHLLSNGATWDSEAVIQFVAGVAGNITNAGDALQAMQWLVNNGVAWDDEVMMKFLGNLDTKLIGKSTAELMLESLLGSSFNNDLYLDLKAKLTGDTGGYLATIEAWLAAYGITDTTISKTLEVQLVYSMHASGEMDTPDLADWAYTKLVAASLESVSGAYALVKQVMSLMTMLGDSENTGNIGKMLYNWSPLAQQGFSSVSDLQSGVYNVFTYAGYPTAWAEGGVVSSPTYGVVGEAGYPEAIIPMKDGMNIPVKWINGGSTGRGDNDQRTINLTVEIAGKEFEGNVKAWADDVVVMRNKRGKSNDTRRYYR